MQVEGAGERGLAMLAGAQRGVVHRRQIEALGIGRGSIAHRVSVGSLYRVLPSVFAVGYPTLPPLALEVAALLYAGDGSALSHGTAAAIWGLGSRSTELVEATLAGRNVRQCPTVRLYRVAELDSRDVRITNGMPVTAPARTLLDLAGSATDLALERALSEARALGLITDRQLDAAIARSPLRTGVARLRALMRSEAAPALTRSEAERRMLRLTADAQLPRPDVNGRLLGYEVDFLWRAAKLAVEVDGYGFHGHRGAFERDRRRDQALVAAGWRVLRVTWGQLEGEPLAVMVRIGQALAA